MNWPGFTSDAIWGESKTTRQQFSVILLLETILEVI
jgi:hypothetical protein